MLPLQLSSSPLHTSLPPKISIALQLCISFKNPEIQLVRENHVLKQTHVPREHDFCIFSNPSSISLSQSSSILLHVSIPIAHATQLLPVQIPEIHCSVPEA
jgi:hypothetical protein